MAMPASGGRQFGMENSECGGWRGWRCGSGGGGGNAEFGLRNWGAGDGAVGDACQRRRYGGLRPASPVRGEGYSKRSACGRSSALTRRGAVLLHARVNCAPAKGCVWPVLAPAQAWVRAGGRGALRLWRGRGCVGADSRFRHSGIIGDMTGSDKRRPHCGWPGRSGCIVLSFLALRGSKWKPALPACVRERSTARLDKTGRAVLQ